MGTTSPRLAELVSCTPDIIISKTHQNQHHTKPIWFFYHCLFQLFIFKHILYTYYLFSLIFSRENGILRLQENKKNTLKAIKVQISSDNYLKIVEQWDKSSVALMFWIKFIFLRPLIFQHHEALFKWHHWRTFKV